MTKKTTPIKNYSTSSLSAEENLFARKLINDTLNVFTDLRGNHYLDIIEKPSRYIRFFKTDHPIKKTKQSKADKIHISQLALKDQHQARLLFQEVINSYHFKLGNCAFMAKVALYLASKHGKEVLQSASLVSLWSADHVILKLTFKNNREVFIDPWFKNNTFEGAMFLREDAKQYYKDVTDILRKSVLIQTPIAGFLVFALMSFGNANKNLDILNPSLITTCALLVLVQVYYSMHKLFLNPILVDMFIIQNQDVSDTIQANVLHELALTRFIKESRAKGPLNTEVLIEILKNDKNLNDALLANKPVVTTATFGLIESVCDKNLFFSRHKRSHSLPNMLEPQKDVPVQNRSYSSKRRMSF